MRWWSATSSARLREMTDERRSRGPEARATERSKMIGSRREFLRGAGVALALPWMESLQLLRADTAPAPPLRFACIYWSNGIDPQQWWVKGSGASMEFGP